MRRLKYYHSPSPQCRCYAHNIHRLHRECYGRWHTRCFRFHRHAADIRTCYFHPGHYSARLHHHIPGG